MPKPEGNLVIYPLILTLLLTTSLTPNAAFSIALLGFSTFHFFFFFFFFFLILSLFLLVIFFLLTSPNKLLTFLLSVKPRFHFDLGKLLFSDQKRITKIRDLGRIKTSSTFTQIYRRSDFESKVFSTDRKNGRVGVGRRERKKRKIKEKRRKKKFICQKCDDPVSKEFCWLP